MYDSISEGELEKSLECKNVRDSIDKNDSCNNINVSWKKFKSCNQNENLNKNQNSVTVPIFYSDYKEVNEKKL